MKSNFVIQIHLLVSMLFVGVVFALVFHLIIMPYFGGRLFHCISSGMIFGLVNFFLVSLLYKKYFSLKESNIMLQSKVNNDSLTGLFNRRALEIDKEILKDNKNYSVVFIDIDNFRDYNNTYGHLAADTILKKVSETIKANVRIKDKVYRYGGEEIVAILDDCNKNNALAVAEKIKFEINGLSNHPYPGVTVSIGIANYPQDGNEFDEVIKSSDNAMLDAKKQGKNLIVLSSVVS